MVNYNFSGDQSDIFPSGYIRSVQEDVASSSGELESGCFFQESTERLAQINSSWATGMNIPGFDYPNSATSNIIPLLHLMANYTNCGISPILNTTLLNVTARDDYRPYQNYLIQQSGPGHLGNPRTTPQTPRLRPTSSFAAQPQTWTSMDVGGSVTVPPRTSQLVGLTINHITGP